ncbi:hypothetical protein [Ramlibacter alkalitolerans]|uniref:Uncharacterized protein n=1 Tax=Ramlibacter alkalitolerans TaxID=2039631 RepID=A0ABS1JTY4_9BURK|nr:hypothetical protein [Ramlibacter alkalitolerans]MBL0427759.1 hypothetical protein [Ramlibacter alkalitolerans]
MLTYILLAMAVIGALVSTLVPGDAGVSMGQRIREQPLYAPVVRRLFDIQAEWAACSNAASPCAASRGAVEAQAPVVVATDLIASNARLFDNASGTCAALKTWASDADVCGGTTHPAAALAVAYTVTGSCYSSGVYVAADCLPGGFAVRAKLVWVAANDTVSSTDAALTKAMSFFSTKVPSSVVDPSNATATVYGAQQ